MTANLVGMPVVGMAWDGWIVGGRPLIELLVGKMPLLFLFPNFGILGMLI